MPILDLSKLLPGDLILETGDSRIARGAGNGKYGHASVALGRLVKIEAGKDNGVEVGLFDLNTWTDGVRVIVGPKIDGDVLVRRLPQAPSVRDILTRALGEAGRSYATPDKLGQLDDLTPGGEIGIRYWARLHQTPPANALEGRFCSEVAATLLGLPKTLVSPSALAGAAELETTAGVVVPEEGWRVAGRSSARAAVAAAMNGASGGRYRTAGSSPLRWPPPSGGALLSGPGRRR